jgi:hypothetical protein
MLRKVLLLFDTQLNRESGRFQHESSYTKTVEQMLQNKTLGTNIQHFTGRRRKTL